MVKFSDMFGKANMVSDYSDNVEGVRWGKRPDLDFYKSIGFHIDFYEQKNPSDRYRSYGDCRDFGYICSVGNGRKTCNPQFDIGTNLKYVMYFGWNISAFLYSGD